MQSYEGVSGHRQQHSTVCAAARTTRRPPVTLREDRWFHKQHYAGYKAATSLNPPHFASHFRPESTTPKANCFRMAGVAGLLVMLLMAAAEASVGSSNSSSFCTETEECLLFEPVCKTEEYEVRHYDPARWVSTDAESLFMEVGTTVAYRRLFKYITGANEDGVKINMTAPILIKIPEEKRKWKATVYTLSFLLPSAYQENPPKPTNEKVYFTDMSDMTVYVRSYGGWILSVTSGLHSHLLRKDLNGAQASYNNSYNYAVGYDSPMKLLHRHNEVCRIEEVVEEQVKLLYVLSVCLSIIIKTCPFLADTN
ncbi:hypothetical protein AGOR_G00196610 [Albula goreensis]|uniref:Heme-binding protein 1 n=1 Tax=Albula goreensis TaxID=1534307 RepID=A0A8T3CRD4_9TELE|nr:hypothetical protein AGOR_G00196610 [Albula goreensis]